MATSALLCPDCGGEPNDRATEVFCPDCGVVLDDQPIDHGPDWRSFADEDTNPERAYPGNPNRSDRGLGTNMGTARERTGTDHRQAMYQKHSQIGPSKARNRDYCTGEIDRIGAALDLARSTRDQAKRLFRRLHANDLLQGRDLDTVAAACVLAVCRYHQRGLTAADVAGHARAEEPAIAARYRWVASELGLQVPPPDPCQRLRVVASSMALSDQDVQRAEYLCQRMDDATTQGSPSVTAAACLYRATDATQAEVSEAAGCTPAAVRNRLEQVPRLDVVG